MDASNIQTNRPLRKLSHWRLGSFPIVQRVGNGAYQLQLPPSMSQLHPAFNVLKLTPALVDSIEGCRPHPPPLPEIMDGKEEWVVEEILDSKMINRKLHYLVKWEGFGVEHNSWKPWDNIHTPQCIMDFHHRHPGAAHCIRATDSNSIQFHPSSSFTVPRHHSLEGGLSGDTQFHKTISRVLKPFNLHTHAVMMPLSQVTIGCTLEPFNLCLFSMTMVSSQVTIGCPLKPFDLQVPIFPLIIVSPLLVM